MPRLYRRRKTFRRARRTRTRLGRRRRSYAMPMGLRMRLNRIANNQTQTLQRGRTITAGIQAVPANQPRFYVCNALSSMTNTFGTTAADLNMNKVAVTKTRIQMRIQQQNFVGLCNYQVFHVGITAKGRSVFNFATAAPNTLTVGTHFDILGGMVILNPAFFVTRKNWRFSLGNLPAQLVTANATADAIPVGVAGLKGFLWQKTLLITRKKVIENPAGDAIALAGPQVPTQIDMILVFCDQGDGSVGAANPLFLVNEINEMRVAN